MLNEELNKKRDLENIDYKLTEEDIKNLEEMPDDEAVVEIDRLIGKNDKVVESDYLSSLIEQEDRMIFYEVENIYRNYSSRRYRNKFSMRKDPPKLIMEDDLGNIAEFNMTENFVDELEGTIKEIRRAYLGYSEPEDINIPEGFVDRIKYYAKNKPIKILFPIFITIVIIVLSLI